MVRDGDCGLELTEVPLVPQAASSTFSKGPPRPGPQARAPLRRSEDGATGDTPARPLRPRPAPRPPGAPGPAGASCGGRRREPSPPPRRKNVLASSFTESAERRRLPATLEVAPRPMGLDSVLHLHPSPPSCPPRGLLPSAPPLHRGDPGPRRAHGLGL